MQIQAIERVKPDVLICVEIQEWETAEYVRDALAKGEGDLWGRIRNGFQLPDLAEPGGTEEKYCPSLRRFHHFTSQAQPARRDFENEWA